MNMNSLPWMNPWTQKLWQTCNLLLVGLLARCASCLPRFHSNLVACLADAFASLGLYFVFLLSRDSPSLSLRSSVFALFALISAICVELAVVALTDNDPIARVSVSRWLLLLVECCLLATTAPTLGSTWALISVGELPLGKSRPADRLVRRFNGLLPQQCVAHVEPSVGAVVASSKATFHQ